MKEKYENKGEIKKEIRRVQLVRHDKEIKSQKMETHTKTSQNIYDTICSQNKRKNLEKRKQRKNLHSETQQD